MGGGAAGAPIYTAVMAMPGLRVGNPKNFPSRNFIEMSQPHDKFLTDSLLSLQKEQSEILKQLTQQNSKLSTLLSEVDNVKAGLEHLNKIVRDGNGQPPLVHRATLIEQKLDELEKSFIRHLKQYQARNELQIKHDQEMRKLHESHKLTLRQKLILLVAGMGITMGSTVVTEFFLHRKPGISTSKTESSIDESRNHGSIE